MHARWNEGRTDIEFISDRDSLTTCVTAINHNIRPRRVGAGITSKIEINTLQFTRISIPTQRRQAVPALLHLKRTVTTNRGVNISGADGVDTGESSPLDGKGLGQVDDTSLASIVAGLSSISIWVSHMVFRRQ